MNATSSDSFFTADAKTEAFPFHLIRESESGYTRIFEYRNSSGRLMIFKTLRQEFADNDFYLHLLHRELEIASALYHPDIAMAIEWLDTSPVGPGFLMEYVNGTPLSALIRNDAITPTLSAEIIRRLTAALEYIHARGFVHRDIKPDNIMVNPTNDTLKIIDFGLACRIGTPATKCGTVGFSAPEQLAGIADADITADVYSLGAVIEALRPRSRRWQCIAQKCMDNNPSKRYPSMEAVRRVTDPSRFRQYLLPAVIVAALISGGGLTYLLTRPEAASSAEAIVLPTVADSTLPTAATDSVTPSPIATEIPQSIPQLTGEPPTPQPAVAESESAALPLKEQVYHAAREAAARQFKWHLNMLAKASTPEEINLAYVGHWKYRAKQDMDKWIGNKVDSKSPYRAELMNTAASTIEDYAKEKEIEDYEAKRATYERTKIVASTGYTIRTGPTRVRKATLQENGEWHYEEGEIDKIDLR